MKEDAKGTEVIDTHSNLLGKKNYVILVPDKDLSDESIKEFLVNALKCSSEYASERLKEIYDLGESCVYSGNLERCELVQILLTRENQGLVTEVNGD